MTWRMARSLDTLLDQVNDLAPGRSKASDGGIGDPNHSARTSDHNPDDRGIVRARDFTDDPAAGLDASELADRLLKSQDPRLRYVISDGRIGSGPSGRQPGVWRPYFGPNAHRKHCHVSVVPTFAADLTAPWAIGPTAQLKPEPAKPVQEDRMEIPIICIKEKTNWLGRPGTGECVRINAVSMAVIKKAGYEPIEIDSEAAMKNALALP